MFNILSLVNSRERKTRMEKECFYEMHSNVPGVSFGSGGSFAHYGMQFGEKG